MREGQHRYCMIFTTNQSMSSRYRAYTPNVLCPEKAMSRPDALGFGPGVANSGLRQRSVPLKYTRWTVWDVISAWDKDNVGLRRGICREGLCRLR